MFQILLQEYECICLLLKVEYECICLLLKVITTLADASTAIEKKGPVQLACVHGSQYEHFLRHKFLRSYKFRSRRNFHSFHYRHYNK